MQISEATAQCQTLHEASRRRTCPRRAEMAPAPGDPAAMLRPAAGEAGTGSPFAGTWCCPELPLEGSPLPLPLSLLG